MDKFDEMEVTLRRGLMPGGVKDLTSTPVTPRRNPNITLQITWRLSQDTTFLDRPLNKITVRCTEEHER
jgi:hypothetical protein